METLGLICENEKEYNRISSMIETFGCATAYHLIMSEINRSNEVPLLDYIINGVGTLDYTPYLFPNDYYEFKRDLHTAIRGCNGCYVHIINPKKHKGYYVMDNNMFN